MSQQEQGAELGGPKTLCWKSIFAQLIAQEDFRAFSRHQIFTSYTEVLEHSHNSQQ
jgi:hypothetical protein